MAMKPDQRFIYGTDVILTTDLTRYHRSLVGGCIGTTVGEATIALHNLDYNFRFVKVKFPEVTLDILWKSLEIK